MENTYAPWKASNKIAQCSDGYSCKIIGSLDTEQYSLAEVWGRTLEELMANASLIAVAPELLEALQNTQKLLLDLYFRSDGSSQEIGQVAEINEKAISKAAN